MRPLRVPRWCLGGRSFPEVRDWPLYADRRHLWFIASADETITAGGENGNGFPAERTVKPRQTYRLVTAVLSL